MILDTNALSALAEGEANITSIVAAARRIDIPVIALGEYRFGIMGSRRRFRYDQWLTAFASDCSIRLIDEETATVYALIRQELKHRGKPIPSNDIWIAALARQHDEPILSRDQHFDAVAGLKRLSW